MVDEARKNRAIEAKVLGLELAIKESKEQGLQNIRKERLDRMKGELYIEVRTQYESEVKNEFL